MAGFSRRLRLGALLPHFDKYVITEDVRFTDRSAEFAEFLLAGSLSTELLERLGLSVSSLPRYGHLSHGSDALSLRSLRRVDWFDSPTWLLSIPVGQRDEVQRALTQAGVREADNDEVHALRIAAGFPIYGIDITEDNLAQEVGRTELAISFTKGCYLGQEPIARIDAMGHVNRRLCRLELSSGPLPDSGTLILDKPAPDGKPIGTITSSAWKWRGDADKPLAAGVPPQWLREVRQPSDCGRTRDEGVLICWMAVPHSPNARELRSIAIACSRRCDARRSLLLPTLRSLSHDPLAESADFVVRSS